MKQRWKKEGHFGLTHGNVRQWLFWPQEAAQPLSARLGSSGFRSPRTTSAAPAITAAQNAGAVKPGNFKPSHYLSMTPGGGRSIGGKRRRGRTPRRRASPARDG